MRYLKITLAAMLLFTAAMPDAAPAADKAEKQSCMSAYYDGQGMLMAVKELRGELSQGETELLSGLYKPDGAASAKVYSWDGEHAAVRSGESFVPRRHDITVISTNDMHGNVIGDDRVIGIDKIAALKKMTPNALLLDAGDATQGAPYAALTRGEDVMFAMNEAGYDGMTLGDHEFDYGFETLFMNVSLAAFPVMSANAVFPQREDGRQIGISSCNIYDLNGTKVGVFGITTADAGRSTNPEGLAGVEFKDEIKTAKEQTAKLRSEGADIIIALTHMGTTNRTGITSDTLASALAGTGLDLIVDGHNDAARCTADSGIPVIHAGKANAHVGNVSIDIGTDGIMEITPLLLSPDFFENIPADDDTAEVIQTTIDEQAELLGEVVSHTGAVLWGGVVNGIAESRIHETNLGDYICDVMLKKAKADLGGEYKSALFAAVENGGGIRACVPAGDVTWRDIISILPFSNMIEYKKIDPKTLYDMLEVSVSSVESQDEKTGLLNTDQSGSFLQISGFAFEYDPDGESGHKVKAVYFDGSDKALDRADTKTEIILASNDYVIGGSGGFDMLKGKDILRSGGGLAETLIAEMRGRAGAEPLIYPLTMNRIRIAGRYKPAEYEAGIYVKDADGEAVRNSELTVYIDGARAKAKTDADGIMKLKVADGPHSISLDAKTAVYVNNYSGAGVIKDGGGLPALVY